MASLFDFGVGAEVTLPITSEGNLRLGPWVEARTRTFRSLSPAGGVELFVGDVPEDFDLFSYTGEGILSFRFGGGYSFEGREGGGLEPEGAILTGTVAWGYRAPWNLWNPYGECECRDEGLEDFGRCRAPARYMIPARLYITGEGSVTGSRWWQVTAGLEFEPVGSFRFLLGLS